MDENTPLLLLSTLDEEEKYKKGYPGLLDNAFAVYIGNRHKLEGLRVKRVFVAQSVSVECAELEILSNALLFWHEADAAPIFLLE